MIIHIVCDLKNPEEKTDIRTLLLHLDEYISYNVTPHVTALGILRDVEMYEDSSRLALLTVEFEYPYSGLFDPVESDCD